MGLPDQTAGEEEELHPCENRWAGVSGQGGAPILRNRAGGGCGKEGETARRGGREGPMTEM